MGVAGSGKTTVGRELAAKLGGRFVDADDFHPAENVLKMASGVPLEDADRWPWLDRLRREVVETADGEMITVLACSALKRVYRQRLGVDVPTVALVYLAGPAKLLRERLEKRPGHFMGADMLESQLAALEVPDADEGIRVSIDKSVGEVVVEIVRMLGCG